ncbi:MAG: DUF2202 domain-containing protein [Gammaproteobacteria bacterium]
MYLKHTFLGFALLSIMGVAQPVVAAGGPSANNASAQQTQRAKNPTASLSYAERNDILFMREEEKLACDVYTYLHQLWGSAVFANIADSEQRHMDSMEKLVVSDGLTDPVQDDSTGAFTNPELASLYVRLTTRRQVSKLEALYVGAYIEEIDTRDIQQAIDRATHADIIKTYESLLRGSRNHLRAFVRTIENMGVVYEAQELPQSEVDAIVDSPVERSR